MTENRFSLEPLLELSKVFLVLFTLLAHVSTIIDLNLSLLMSKREFVLNQHLVFWLSGFLSSLLDNVPTYLIFFKVMGGNPAFLMHEGAVFLKALSLGTVCMGALTYIGNAPNFLIKNVAERKNITILNFFVYSLVASCFLMPPLYIIDKFFI